MSSKKLVKTVTAFLTHEGYLYETHDEAVISAAGSALYDAAQKYNDIEDNDAVEVDFEALAKFLRENRALVRQVLGL